MNLAEKVVAVHAALHQVPHAFGGALALAYYAEPRATVDIDINIFLSSEDHRRAIDPLVALGATAADNLAALIDRDGQVRIWWDQTPLDLFFSYDPFHDAAKLAAQTVPFADTTIRVLAAEHLVVCKATFNRPKDWVDIAAMLAEGTRPDVAECLRWLGRVVGDTDTRYDRLAAVLSS